ncbi:hypothetical protein [Candidatus Chloroploca asiatica]|uniref:hypothetical protein n=1 Tax=Candidatus Chloroploca asiatica TaxID=1506545 RepID=UPI001FE33000|nr:hypothetical protein [Candidatus Chloroploca asiatica]
MATAKTSTQRTPSFTRLSVLLRTHWLLWLALLIGAVLRLALWDSLPRVGLISDEAEYLAAADWLANGRGFAWHTQYLWTRAPLYPLFVAAHVGLFGRDLGPIFVTQTLLSLANIVLTYLLVLFVVRPGEGRERVAAGLAALGMAVYLPLASYAQLLLSETLFTTLLLAAMLMFGRWATVWVRHEEDFARPGRAGESHASGGGFLPQINWPLLAAGMLLGLATLTRGLTLGFVPLVLAWVGLTAWHTTARLRQAMVQVGLVLAAFVLIVAPWSLYASRAYGGLITVDTTGAFNLALGARTAYDGGRSDEPTRNFVLALLLPELSVAQREDLLNERYHPDGSVARPAACLYAREDPRLTAALATVATLRQGDRQQLLSAEALCLLQAKPLAFVVKSLTELIDLFKINYTGDERLSRGFALGRLPVWYTLALVTLDDLLYVLVLPLSLLGWATLRTRQRAGPGSAGAHALAGLIGLWLLYNLAAAPLLFAINRFRVPLMPFALIFAGVALAHLPQLGATLRTRYGAACGVLASLLLLVAAAPYAYFEPRAPGADATWSSFLGPYPSSIANTRLALASRQGFLQEEALRTALGAGDRVAARAALASPALPSYAAAVGAPLLDGLEGRPEAGLDRLATQPKRPLAAWQTAVVAGELLRQMGDLQAARREFGPSLVDDQNPVTWTWQWFYPPRLSDDRLELADDNDLGYIKGFYLGRYDPDLGATTRWATGTAMLRFPGAGNGAPQQLCLHLSGLGWPEDLELPVVTVSVGVEEVGRIALTRSLEEACLPLPAQPEGSHLVITTASATFVPSALDLIAQQGPQVGQLRLLAYQLDRAVIVP